MNPIFRYVTVFRIINKIQVIILIRSIFCVYYNYTDASNCRDDFTMKLRKILP